MKCFKSAGSLAVFSLCALAMPFSFLGAAEVRTWMSTKGGTIEASFQKMEKETVHLVKEDSKVIQVAFSELSLGDRQYLVEEAELDEKMLFEQKLTVPEEDFKFNKDTLKPHKKKMAFGPETHLQFKVLESEHFYIAYTGKFRPQALVEMAERIWYGMAFNHQTFRENWGDRKKVIIVTDNDEVYESLGQYYTNWLRENTVGEEAAEGAANRNELLWMKVVGNHLRLPEEQREEYNAFATASVLRIKDGNDQGYKKVFGPFPTNQISAAVVGFQMGGMNGSAPTGFFGLTRAHAYFKEIQLAKKSETTILDSTAYRDDNQITTARGFKDGRAWAKTLRKLVRKGDVKPDLEKFLLYASTNLTPTQLVLMYSFGYYVQSDLEKLDAYSELLRKVKADREVPEASEIAEIFGFDSVQAFNESWTEFVKSSAFK